MIPSREQVKLAAISVAETTCANPSPAGQIIPREYLWEHELRYRGSFFDRVRDEVLERLV